MSTKVLLSGGGTAGHTMPLVAVADYLLAEHPQVELMAVMERSAQQQPLRDDIKTYFISSGKYRRYYGRSRWAVLTDWRLAWQNLKDLFKVLAGIAQSISLLRRLQPDVIFIKGGYVSVPLGVAANILNVPYVTHDSDTVPGLTNRLLSRGARYNLVAFPESNYTYPAAKLIQVGLPIRTDFLTADYAAARKKLGIKSSHRRLVIFGGSSGARDINLPAAAVASKLAKLSSVLHVTGRSQFDQVRAIVQSTNNYQVVDYVGPGFADQLAAADVVVIRAGATSLAELAALKKAAVVVPHPKLTEGHQLKNAQAVNSHDAGIILDQQLLLEDPELLVATVDELLNDKPRQAWLGNNLHQMFMPNAAQRIGEILYDVAG